MAGGSFRRSHEHPHGQTSEAYSIARQKMVEEQLMSRDITDPRVLAVMNRVPRHLFVDEALQSQAYGDNPLGIGEGQTISQPYIVALMTQALNLAGHEKVLEIGTGCGYQTAVLAELAKQIYTIERVKSLAMKARRHLKELNYRRIVMRVGDGTQGWPEAGPFDAILIAAASPQVPEPLLSQLVEGGRLVVPVGNGDVQNLVCITVREGKPVSEDLGACRFVKLVGKFGWGRPSSAGDKFVKRSLV